MAARKHKKTTIKDLTRLVKLVEEAGARVSLEHHASGRKYQLRLESDGGAISCEVPAGVVALILQAWLLGREHGRGG